MRYFILAALIVLLDQTSKYFLTLKMQTVLEAGGSSVGLIPGIIRMTYVRNTGAAFSFMSDMRWLLVAVTLVVMAVIVFILVRYRDKLGVWGSLGLAGVLGGAFANFIDRALFGYVADFFEFEFIRFAVFNVADIFITVGGLTFCLYYLFHRDIGDDFVLFGRRKAPQNAPEPPVKPEKEPEDGRDTDRS